MQLILTQNLLQQLIFFALKNPRIECCGYLLGKIKDNQNLVCKLASMQNIHPNPYKHFAFCPKEQLKLFKTLQSLQIVGIYHSHPNSPPLLSQEDISYAFFPNQSNFVISLQNGISFASYRVNAKKAKRERIQIIKGS